MAVRKDYVREDTPLDDPAMPLRSQFEPVHMKVKNGIEIGFKLALGFWLFSVIFWAILAAVFTWAGVNVPFFPRFG